MDSPFAVQTIARLLMPGSFHPLYATTLTLCGVGSIVAGVMLLAHREARAQAAGKSVDENRFPMLHQIAGLLAPELIRDPVGQVRRRTAFGAIFFVFVGLFLVGSAITSIWFAQCGAVLDLPPCH